MARSRTFLPLPYHPLSKQYPHRESESPAKRPGQPMVLVGYILRALRMEDLMATGKPLLTEVGLFYLPMARPVRLWASTGVR